MSVQVYHIFLSGRKSILIFCFLFLSICRQGGTQFIAPSHVYHRPRRGMHMGTTTAATTAGTRAAEDVGPYHVQRPRAECVAPGIAG